MYTSMLIIGPCNPGTGQRLRKFLTGLGFTRYPLVKDRAANAQDIIARADAEGGIPITLLWDGKERIVQRLEDLFQADTLPGRRYLLLTPSDVASAIVSDWIERSPDFDPDNERLLVISEEDLCSDTVVTTARMHLTTSHAGYLGRRQPQVGSGSTAGQRPDPAPITELPGSPERNVGNIVPSDMRDGKIKIKKNKPPHF